MADTSRFQDAEKYAGYLKTPAGRPRSELAWETLRRSSPNAESGYSLTTWTWGSRRRNRRQVFELESTLGARPEFAAIARYLQVIARPSGASSRREAAR